MPTNSLYTNGWTGTAKGTDGTYRYGTLAEQLPSAYGKLYIYKPRDNELDIRFVAYDVPTTWVATYTTTNGVGFSGWKEIMTQSSAAVFSCALADGFSGTINGYTYGSLVWLHYRVLSDSPITSRTQVATIPSGWCPMSTEGSYIRFIFAAQSSATSAVDGWMTGFISNSSGAMVVGDLRSNNTLTYLEGIVVYRYR